MQRLFSSVAYQIYKTIQMEALFKTGSLWTHFAGCSPLLLRHLGPLPFLGEYGYYTVIPNTKRVHVS